MIEIGRVCIKTAGRDAGLTGVIVDILDKNFVLIDGQVRRRKCNIIHLELLDKVVKLEKGAPHESVVNALKKIGINVTERKPKPKTERPRRQRKKKALEERVQLKEETSKKDAKEKKSKEKNSSGNDTSKSKE